MSKLIIYSIIGMLGTQGAIGLAAHKHEVQVKDIDPIVERLSALQEGTPISTLFPDRGLAEAIKTYLKKTNIDEPVTDKELSNIKKLTATNMGIVDLSGVQLLRNLVTLDLSNNSIRNTQPLLTLPKLKEAKLLNQSLQQQPLTYEKDIRLHLHDILAFNQFDGENWQQTLTITSAYAHDMSLDTTSRAPSVTFYDVEATNALDFMLTWNVSRVNGKGKVSMSAHVHQPLAAAPIEAQPELPVGEIDEHIDAQPQLPVGATDEHVDAQPVLPVGKTDEEINAQPEVPVGKTDENVEAQPVLPVGETDEDIDAQPEHPIEEQDEHIDAQPDVPAGEGDETIDAQPNLRVGLVDETINAQPKKRVGDVDESVDATPQLPSDKRDEQINAQPNLRAQTKQHNDQTEKKQGYQPTPTKQDTTSQSQAESQTQTPQDDMKTRIETIWTEVQHTLNELLTPFMPHIAMMAGVSATIAVLALFMRKFLG